MDEASIVPFFETLRAANPEPASELEYASIFELLAAVLLSAQATDRGVNKATRRLFATAPTPRKMLALGLPALESAIQSIGLYRTKAKNLHATCHLLVEEHAGQVPRTREALEALPGVGRKTANVVLNTAFGEPTIAVDTHIFRVSNRTGLAPGKDVRAVESRLMRVVPERFRQDAHHWLILHGRYVCKARKPDCPHCAIRDLCLYRQKTIGDRETAWWAYAVSVHNRPNEKRSQPETGAFRFTALLVDQKLSWVRKAYWPVSSPVNSLSPLV